MQKHRIEVEAWYVHPTLGKRRFKTRCYGTADGSTEDHDRLVRVIEERCPELVGQDWAYEYAILR